MSGIVYSALPSGSDILAISNGKSTIIEVAPTVHGNSEGENSMTATGGSRGDVNQSVAAYTGTSLSLVKRSAWIHCVVVLGMAIVVNL